MTIILFPLTKYTKLLLFNSYRLALLSWFGMSLTLLVRRELKNSDFRLSNILYKTTVCQNFDKTNAVKLAPPSLSDPGFPTNTSTTGRNSCELIALRAWTFVMIHSIDCVLFPGVNATIPKCLSAEGAD